jgi:aminopeptidase Y
MFKLLLIAQTASFVLGHANQIPIQNPIEIVEQSSKPSKPLVNSTALQELITAKNLYARSEKLFAIAKTSEKEFNHPTRVIGSAGPFSFESHQKNI